MKPGVVSADVVEDDGRRKLEGKDNREGRKMMKRSK